ncbi:MAG: hypothetical protein IT356_10005 [Gemmatimonadaceae bacterium]|nr:hypothetical protein [Gemmatimonadaceae bacterium]
MQYIELRLRDVQQVINSLYPSPSLVKDLDAKAGRFTVGWSREIPPAEAVGRGIRVAREFTREEAATIADAVHHYFGAHQPYGPCTCEPTRP